MFWILFLAHLLGDYPFQPNWLVANKHRTWALLLHSAIHFLFMFVLVRQVRLLILPQLIYLTIAHMLTDAAKTTISSKGPLTVQSSYLLDQLIHIVLIWLTATWIETSIPAVIAVLSWEWMVIAAGYVFVTYVWMTTERLLTENSPQYNHEVITQVWPRMITRTVFFTIGLILFHSQVNAILLALVNIPYFSGKYRGRALLTDLAVAILTTIVVLIAIG